MNSVCDVFTSHWHLDCHRKELDCNGDFIRFDTPIGEVALFNDNGNIIAFDNKCAHRGAKIYLTDFGNSANTCKYHGWTFSHGKLSISSAEQFKNCDINLATLNKYLVDWVGDFIFFAVKPKQGVYDQLGEVSEILENISFNIAGRHDFSRYDYECHWPLALENALEPYHISMVHPNTLGTLKLEDGENQFYGPNSIWRANLGDARREKQLASLSRFFSIDYQYEGYMSIYMFPFTMISSTFGYSYSIQNFFPSTNNVESTHFTSRLLGTHARNEASRPVAEDFLASTAAVNRRVFEEDHEVCKLLSTDSWSSAPLRYASELEEKIQHFRSLCRAEGL